MKTAKKMENIEYKEMEIIIYTRERKEIEGKLIIGLLYIFA